MRGGPRVFEYGFVVFFWVPWWPRDHQGTTQRRACKFNWQIPHSAGTRGLRDTTRPTPLPPETRTMEDGGCGRAHTISIPIHDRPHQEARPDEQSEHTSVSDETPDSPRCRAGTARQDPDETPTPTRRQEREQATTVCTHKRRYTTKPTPPDEQGITHAGARVCPRTLTRDSHQRHNTSSTKTRARASDDFAATSDNKRQTGDFRQ